MNHEPNAAKALNNFQDFETPKFHRNTAGLPNTQTQLKIMSEESEFLQQRVSPQRQNNNLISNLQNFQSPKPTVPDYSLVDDEQTQVSEKTSRFSENTSRSLHPEDNLEYNFKIRETGFSKSSSTSVLPKFSNTHHNKSNPSTPTHQNSRRKTTGNLPSPTSSRKGTSEIRASRAEFKHLIQENLNQSDNIKVIKDNIKNLQSTINNQQVLITQLVNQVSENNRQMEHMRVELLDKTEMISDLQRELIQTVSEKNFDKVTKVLQNVECQTRSLYRGEVETQTDDVWNAEEQNYEMQSSGQIRRIQKLDKQGFKNVFNIQQSFTPSAITDQCTMNTSNHSPELGDSATNYQHKNNDEEDEYENEEERMLSEIKTELKQADPSSTTSSEGSNLDEVTPIKIDDNDVENIDPNSREQHTVSFHSEKSSKESRRYSERSSLEKVTREEEENDDEQESPKLQKIRQQLENLGIELDPRTGNIVMSNRPAPTLKGPSPDFMNYPAQNNLSMHANAIAMKYSDDKSVRANQKVQSDVENESIDVIFKNNHFVIFQQHFFIILRTTDPY